VDTTIFNALERRASDIHIETRDQEVVIKYRIDGVLHYAMPPISKDWHSTIISRIKVMSELDIAERRVPQDGRFRVRYKGRLIDFRVSIMPTIHGEDAVLRVLDKESMSEKFAKLSSTSWAFGCRPGEVSALHQASPTEWCWSPAQRVRAKRRRSTPA
jgi:type IV pilus assembly protein PilB